MSRTKPTAYENDETLFACNYCGVMPLVWCRTTSGAWARFLHVERHWTCDAAHGYSEAGRREMGWTP